MVTDEPDSPHKLASRVKCESYFACAETDKWALKEAIDVLQGALKDGKAPYRIEWYPGSEHGFAFPLRPVYHKPSAERHWERLFDLFRRRLSA